VTAPEERAGIDFAHLEYSRIEGHVYRQDGVTPVAGAQVHADDYDSGNCLAGAETRDDGSYTLLVPPGTYRVNAYGWRCSFQWYDHADYWDAAAVTVGESETIENIDFSLECTPFRIDALRWSTKWAGGLELQWQSMPDATYRIYWNPGSLGDQGTWQEVPNAQDDILQQDDTMIWTDRGTAPGMDGKRPGDPSVRQRYYVVVETPD